MIRDGFACPKVLGKNLSDIKLVAVYIYIHIHATGTLYIYIIFMYSYIHIACIAPGTHRSSPCIDLRLHSYTHDLLVLCQNELFGSGASAQNSINLMAGYRQPRPQGTGGRLQGRICQN